MAKLTDLMKRYIAQQKLGYVASVNADGTPNLSPKATFVVLDDEHIAFAEMRSPNTVANIKERSQIEVNFVDIFTRKGFRAKGPAAFHERGTDAFDALLPSFSAWGELTERFRGIVKIHIERAIILTSPAYDRGAVEEELHATWKAYYSAL